MSDMQDRVRLDKWLWAARFYKTRGLAQGTPSKLGHVSLNGERAKPSRLVKAGDRIELRLNQLEYMLNVLLPLDRRGSATIARTMYQETAESQYRGRPASCSWRPSGRVFRSARVGRPRRPGATLTVFVTGRLTSHRRRCMA